MGQLAVFYYNTAQSHGCEEILDPSYKPSTSEENNLFIEKQKFFYSVFQECLQTDMGKHYVRHLLILPKLSTKYEYVGTSVIIYSQSLNYIQVYCVDIGGVGFGGQCLSLL